MDGSRETCWSSEFSDPQWVAVDLGGTQTVSRMELIWEAAYAKSYRIQVSSDGKHWEQVYWAKGGAEGTKVIRFAPTPARWLRISAARRGNPFGYSLWEFAVYC